MLIVSDEEIRELNRDFLGRDRPTNVISFPMQEGEESGLHADLLGDVVISADTAARDAAEAGTDFEKELYFLLLHGILHLCGMDDHDDADRQRMLQRQSDLLEAFERETGQRW